MHPQRATPGDPFPAVASSWSLRAPEKPWLWLDCAGQCGEKQSLEGALFAPPSCLSKSFRTSSRDAEFKTSGPH